MKIYCVYDLHYKEQCIGVFEKIKDVAKYFNTTESAIRTDITKKYKRKHRYIIEKLEIE